MYPQCDGMAMGSPLGPTFANFFMVQVENRALDNINESLPLYCRYIDDIFLICDEELLVNLKDEMTVISGLNFTIEIAVENKLPFLNVLIDKTERGIKATVYRKPTDAGQCLNAAGECPLQYKTSVIKGFLYRAKKLTSEKVDMMLEISRAKQVLVNNGYSNSLVDAEIRKFLKQESTQKPIPPGVTHKVFYRNFMNPNYRQDEMSIKQIIKSNVTMKDPNNRIQVIIYYKSTKTRDLFMKNNLQPKPRDLSRTRLIYDFDCQKDECEHLPTSLIRYTGVTTCQLTRRLSYHLQNGAIQKHSEQKHNCKLTREEIVQWTKIRCYESDVRRLEILESLIIRFEDPVINLQDTGKGY